MIKLKHLGERKLSVKELICNTSKSYRVLIEKDILNYSGVYIKKFSNAKKVLVVTDDNVAELYSARMVSNLKKYFQEVYLFVLKSGEESKSLDIASKLYNYLADKFFDRQDLIVSFGGGVVGDVAGFIASTYKRGIDFMQIPTSLLAQVDASIGGKNGINLEYGKNLIGTFYQPKLVLIDPILLNTLPKSDFNDGMAEIIKCAMIKSDKLFEKIVNFKTGDDLEEIIYESIDIKRKIVEADEFESCERKLLNFGHTIGHAIEKIYDYKKYSHGKAVSIGMATIVRAGELLNLTEPGCYNKLICLLKKFDLPYEFTCPIEDVLENCLNDKKAYLDYIDLVLIHSIGRGFIKKILKSKLKEYIRRDIL